MTENKDDLLLEQFFQPAREMQLADDGFTQRVMQRLPDRQMQRSRLWTAACVVLSLALFTLVGGWRLLALGVLKMLTTVPTTGQVAQLWIALVVVSVLLVTEVLRRERILFERY